MQAYRTAIKLNPNDVDAHYNLALAFKSNGESLDETIASLRKAIVVDPNDADAFINLGDALKLKKDQR